MQTSASFRGGRKEVLSLGPLLTKSHETIHIRLYWQVNCPQGFPFFRDSMTSTLVALRKSFGSLYEHTRFLQLDGDVKVAQLLLLRWCTLHVAADAYDFGASQVENVSVEENKMSNRPIFGDA